MKYYIYHSESAQSYTLVKERSDILEDDAKLVKVINAPNWPAACDKYEKYLEDRA